jgi:hypothetical protein
LQASLILPKHSPNGMFCAMFFLLSCTRLSSGGGLLYNGYSSFLSPTLLIIHSSFNTSNLIISFHTIPATCL